MGWHLRLFFILAMGLGLSAADLKAQAPNPDPHLRRIEGQLRRELRKNPQSALAWFNLGQALRAQERCSEALSAYQRVIRLKSPLAPAAQIYRSACWLDLGQPARARTELSSLHHRELPPSLLEEWQYFYSQAEEMEPGLAPHLIRTEFSYGLDSNAYLLPDSLQPKKNSFWRLGSQLVGPTWQGDFNFEEYNLDAEQSPTQKTSRAFSLSLARQHEFEWSSIDWGFSPQLALDFLEGQLFLTRPSLEWVAQGQQSLWRLSYQLESRLAGQSQARYSASVWNRLHFSYALEPQRAHQWIPFLEVVDRQGEGLELPDGETLPLAYRGFGPGLRWQMDIADRLSHDFSFKILRKSYKDPALPANIKRLDQEVTATYRLTWRWDRTKQIFTQYETVINSSNLGEGIFLEDRNYRQWLLYGGLIWTSPL